MFKNISKIAISFLVVGSLVTGCGSTQPAPAPTTPSTSTTPATQAATTIPALGDVIKNALPGTGVAMVGVSNSFDNMYYAAKGGNWALAAYMSDVMQDYMSPIQITRAAIYPQWTAFVKANLGDDGALKKARDAKDMAAFETAYTTTMNNCNTCHAAQGFKFIKKIKAPAPVTYLDYSLKSDASENK